MISYVMVIWWTKTVGIGHVGSYVSYESRTPLQEEEDNHCDLDDGCVIFKICSPQTDRSASLLTTKWFISVSSVVHVI